MGIPLSLSSNLLFPSLTSVRPEAPVLCPKQNISVGAYLSRYDNTCYGTRRSCIWRTEYSRSLGPHAPVPRAIICFNHHQRSCFILGRQPSSFAEDADSRAWPSAITPMNDPLRPLVVTFRGGIMMANSF